jgi:hypothetical protein
MSVLLFPRIYFKGYMGWDPPTSNNNDYLPVYDIPDAALDWDYLGTQGITPDNFREIFRPWMIKPHVDSCPDPNAGPSDTCQSNPTSHMASRWDYYGGGGCWFVDYEAGGKRTLTTGGDKAYNTPASPSDPIIGQSVTISGNTFGGRESYARLVDVNPSSPWSSQIIFATLGVGDFISGPQYLKMHSRSFMAPRNIAGDLIIAGAIGVVFQTTMPFDSLSLNNAGNSELLNELIQAMRQPGAQGLMFRFSAYNTLYYQNGIYNDIPQQPRTCDELTTLYENGEVFMNPAYSQVVGVFGVWKTGELSTTRGGHFLVPNAKATPISQPSTETELQKDDVVGVAGHAGLVFSQASRTADSASSGPPLAFGTVTAEVDFDNNLVSLDLINTIPEFASDGTKFDYGPITVGVLSSSGAFNPIGSFGFDQYNKEAYEAKAGIVDVPFQAGVTAQDVQTWLANGKMALQVQNQYASLERVLTAETDSRGIYLDQCRVTEFKVQVRYKNRLPPAGTQIKLAQYYPWQLNVGSGQWVLFGAEPPKSQQTNPVCAATPEAEYLHFLDGDIIDVDGNGFATVRIGYLNPGFPTIAFYPFLPGEPQPAPQSEVTFGFTDYSTYTIGNAYYTVARVMPNDNALPQQFVNRWNGTGSYAGQPKYDRTLTWQFIYNNILYVYDMLYPVMDQFMPLGNLGRVEGAIDQLVTMVSEDWVEKSTLYMPVTRELSAAKRLILETWGNLVIRRYPQQDLPPITIQCD